MVDNESQEMYLETILKIKKRKGSVRAIEIAEELGYSKPSVSRAVGIMKKDGFIIVRPDGQIELTESGKVKAEYYCTGNHHNYVEYYFYNVPEERLHRL